MDPLRLSLKKMVIKECNVRGIAADQVSDEDQIIAGEGALKLDSLDAVEIVAALDRHLGLKVDNAGESRKIFKSFAVLGDYVKANAPSAQVEAFVTRHQGV